MFCQFLLSSKVTQSYIYIYVYTHTHTHTFFFSYHPPSCSIPRDWTPFPVLYSRTFIHSILFTYLFIVLLSFWGCTLGIWRFPG